MYTMDCPNRKMTFAAGHAHNRFKASPARKTRNYWEKLNLKQQLYDFPYILEYKTSDSELYRVDLPIE
jgi:hypothetical protein